MTSPESLACAAPAVRAESPPPVMPLRLAGHIGSALLLENPAWMAAMDRRRSEAEQWLTPAPAPAGPLPRRTRGPMGGPDDGEDERAASADDEVQRAAIESLRRAHADPGDLAALAADDDGEVMPPEPDALSRTLVAPPRSLAPGTGGDERQEGPGQPGSPGGDSHIGTGATAPGWLGADVFESPPSLGDLARPGAAVGARDQSPTEPAPGQPDPYGQPGDIPARWPLPGEPRPAPSQGGPATGLADPRRDGDGPGRHRDDTERLTVVTPRHEQRRQPRRIPRRTRKRGGK